MNALQSTLVTFGIVLSLAACDSKSEGEAGKPAAAAAGTGTGAAKAAAPALRDAAGKLTSAGFDAAWKDVYMGMKAANEPADKKAAAFEAKVGKPAKVEGDKKIWWTFEGTSCFKVELGADGTKGSEKVPADKCEK